MGTQWDIEGKTVLITGGASGLGALYAEGYLKEGAKNVAILDIAEEVGKATTNRLNGLYPGKVIFVRCDAGDERDLSEAFNQVLNEFKQVDVIINNAGIMSDAPGLWRKACDVNWQGVVSLTMKGVAHMRKDEGGVGGTIINVSSNAAMLKWRQLPIYSGSKMAVLHFSQSLAVEPFYQQTGVRILVICFGPTDTPLLHGTRERAYDDRTGVEVEMIFGASTTKIQKAESAVTACIKMFKEGSNGSIWVSVNDRPANDITPHMDAVFKDFENIIFP